MTTQTKTQTKPKRTRRFFSHEDKVKIVDRITKGESYDAVSTELNIHRNLLHAWVAKLKGSTQSGANEESADIAILKAQIEDLREQRDFFERTAKMFASQQGVAVSPVRRVS